MTKKFLSPISRCGPCQRIAPVFDQLSSKYANAVFLKVDVDKCAETAAGQGVSAMPTFIFYRNRTKLDLCQGADPAGLESRIQRYYGSGDGDSSEGSVAGHVQNNSYDSPLYHVLGLVFLVLILYFWKDL